MNSAVLEPVAECAVIWRLLSDLCWESTHRWEFTAQPRSIARISVHCTIVLSWDTSAPDLTRRVQIKTPRKVKSASCRHWYVRVHPGRGEFFCWLLTDVWSLFSHMAKFKMNFRHFSLTLEYSNVLSKSTWVELLLSFSLFLCQSSSHVHSKQFH